MSGPDASLSLVGTTSTPVPPRSLYLLSGAAAGLSVDLVLFPLDTIKTRMQSRGGIAQAGGFKKLFSGVASAAAGSAPTAALFFVTYESCKLHLTPLFHPVAPTSTFASGDASTASVNPLVHCLSASAAEVMACLVRVPTENVKQKVQAGMYRSSWECFRALLGSAPLPHLPGTPSPAPAPAVSASPFSNFYRGFSSTILREIPFAFIQFPLYEYSKWRVGAWRRERGHTQPIEGWQCALLGSASGGVAAALTTPLDVVKTRLMLQRAGTGGEPTKGVVQIFQSVYAEGGVKRLFSGVVPRVLWISIGGGVFFGAYEMSKRKLIAIL